MNLKMIDARASERAAAAASTVETARREDDGMPLRLLGHSESQPPRARPDGRLAPSVFTVTKFGERLK